MEFKDKLRKIRKENSLSRQALADAIYVINEEVYNTKFLKRTIIGMK